MCAALFNDATMAGNEVGRLYRNMRELIAIDQWFGIETIAKAEGEESADAISSNQQSVKMQNLIPCLPGPEPDEIRQSLAALHWDGDKQAQLTQLAKHQEHFAPCPIHGDHRPPILGDGDPQARLMFIGEAPGAEEDRQKRPFVGPAGQLLNKMIAAMGFTREQVYITNIIKNRPPGNRTPSILESRYAMPFLEQEAAIVQPQIIVTLGNTPLKALRDDESFGITRYRGQMFTWQGFKVIPTFHPSYLLRNEAAKKPCWQDLQQVMSVLAQAEKTGH